MSDGDWGRCKSLVNMLQDHIDQVDSASTRRDIESSQTNQRSVELARHEIYTAMLLQSVILILIAIVVSR